MFFLPLNIINLNSSQYSVLLNARGEYVTLPSISNQSWVSKVVYFVLSSFDCRRVRIWTQDLTPTTLKELQNITWEGKPYANKCQITFLTTGIHHVSSIGMHGGGLICKSSWSPSWLKATALRRDRVWDLSETQ